MRRLAILFFLFLASVAQAATAPPEVRGGSGAALRSTYEGLRDRLAKSPFNQPLHLEAAEEESHLRGHAYAVLSHPFAEASNALADPAQWCEILLLPFNTKHCEAAGGASGRGALTVMLGRRVSTPIENTHRLGFSFVVASRTPDYLRVVLTAPEGPFTTRDYEIVLELVPVDERRTFLHLGYRYGYGNVARAAMRAYLATIGSRKVGFTVEGQDDSGRPALVRGMRGAMERNTMRYYLAIEAYMRALKAPQSERVTRMIEDWFASIERYPRQLHELERAEYVSMKEKEFQRMRAGVSPVRRTASSSP